jgi:hypothetical protein
VDRLVRPRLYGLYVLQWGDRVRFTSDALVYGGGHERPGSVLVD